MKVSIFGLGKVGIQTAFCCFTQGVADELVLVSRDLDKARGEAEDLIHGNGFLDHQVHVTAGTLEESAHSDVVLICASVSTPESLKSRHALLKGNIQLFKQLIPEIARVSPNAVLIVVSNPVDVLTWYTLKLSGFPKERVLGTGTLLDSARFRTLLSQKLSIHPDDIRAYILGEHGDTQFPLLSQLCTGMIPILNDQPNPTLESCFASTVNSGYRIFQSKGCTNHAISLAATMIVDTIRFNRKRTLPVSVWIEDYYNTNHICLSLPVVVGKKGIHQFLKPKLNATEIEHWRHCAEVVGKAIKAIN